MSARSAQIKYYQSEKGREKVAAYYREHKEAHNEISRRNNFHYRAMWIEFCQAIGYGSCHHCGYDKCFSALEFHHPDPMQKKANVSRYFRGVITPEKVAELKRTIPLCSNCHAELHENLRKALNE